MRHVAHHGHGGVMLLAAQRHHAGVEAGHQLVQVLEVLGHGGLVGAEDPVRTLEQIGAGAGDAALLGAGHGMARHVARRGRQKLGGRGEDVAFGGDGVGDNAGIAPVAQAGEVVVHSGHRRGDDHELTIVFDESAEGGVVGPEAASHQPRSVAAAQVAASVSTPKTRTPGILAASAPASDAPMSPRPMTATAEKGALAPFSSADSVMGVSVSSIDQVPVTTHCIRTNRPRAQTPSSAAFSARLSASAMFDRIPFGVIY